MSTTMKRDMRSTLLFLVVIVFFFLAGLVAGRRTLPLVKESKQLSTVRSGAPVCRSAGGYRISPTGKEEVYLPGIRMASREDNWSEAVWVPVAKLNEIQPQELVLAVVVLPTVEEVGWVVFESLRAVKLPRSEIAQLLVKRFAPGHEVLSLIMHS
jgi:hypothetical protein